MDFKLKLSSFLVLLIFTALLLGSVPSNSYCQTYTYGFPFHNFTRHCLCDGMGDTTTFNPVAAALNLGVYALIALGIVRVMVWLNGPQFDSFEDPRNRDTEKVPNVAGEL